MAKHGSQETYFTARVDARRRVDKGANKNMEWERGFWTETCSTETGCCTEKNALHGVCACTGKPEKGDICMKVSRSGIVGGTWLWWSTKLLSPKAISNDLTTDGIAVSPKAVLAKMDSVPKFPKLLSATATHANRVPPSKLDLCQMPRTRRLTCIAISAPESSVRGERQTFRQRSRLKEPLNDSRLPPGGR